jgi:hypothetical protein
MWSSHRRARATHTTHSRLIAAAAVALLAGVGLSACTASSTPSPGSASSPSDPSASAARPLPENTGDEYLEPGTYLVTGFTVPFEITVPEGWKSFGWGVLKDNGVDWQVFVNFLAPTSVPTDACRWRGTFIDVEPSPEAYVDAMAAQTSSQTTPPVEITVGEYSGYEFDYAVESGVDITTCDEARLCLFADGGMTQCTRTHEHPSERETERAIDLNGELAMIAVGQFIDVDPALTAEARAVFDSITFLTE